MSVAANVRHAALLERALNYTRGSLAMVRDLSSPTPCAGWDLDDLLRHMYDSLCALCEAGEVGVVDLAPSAVVSDPLGAVRALGCRLLDAWLTPVADPIEVHGRVLATDLLSAAGAIEVAVHGWDVSVACGTPTPIPRYLATDLLAVAPLVVSDEDRPGRFGYAITPAPDASPSDRLLAYLGRRP